MNVLKFSLVLSHGLGNMQSFQKVCLLHTVQKGVDEIHIIRTVSRPHSQQYTSGLTNHFSPLNLKKIHSAKI